MNSLPEGSTGTNRMPTSTIHSDDDKPKQNENYEDGRITVSVRVRPLNSRESKACANSCIAALSAYNTLYIFPPNEVHQDFNALITQDPKLRGVAHHRFTFDHVYPTDATQEQVYEQIGHPVLQSSFCGYHTCIFAYGQTSSGKSYCMMGADGGRSIDDAPGIVPRLCQEMFADMATRKEAAADNNEQVEFSVYVSYLEIYRERVRSLLDEAADAKVGVPKALPTPRTAANTLRRTAADLPPPSLEGTPDGNLRVREHPTLGVYVEGLAEIPVTSVEQVLQLMVRGNHRRHTASTRMNDTSSRSHAIFTIQLIQRRLRTVLPSKADHDGVLHHESDSVSSNGGGSGPSNATELTTATSELTAATTATAEAVTTMTQLGAKINLVDLAGSERAKATGAEGDTLKEGAQINKSLTTLGIVINALATQSTTNAAASHLPKSGGTTTTATAVRRHIPYRDSTLTFLLKESLGGNSKTFMIATVSPSADSYDESVSTLRYADRAKAIVMRAFVNETAGDKRIRELEEEVMRLRERIKALLDAEAMRSSNVAAEALSSLAPSPSQRTSQTPIVLTDSDSCSPTPLADTAARNEASNGDSGSTDMDGVVTRADENHDRKRNDEGGEGGGEREENGLYDALPSTSPPSASPTEPQEGLVSILQGELRRAEEMIRQMSVTQAERDAHIAKLMEEQARERAAMRAATAEARQQAERAAATAAFAPVASPVQTTSVMRLARDEPYLLNMDGAGNWVVAHLGPLQTYVGVFHSHKSQKTTSERTDSDVVDAPPRNPEDSYDSSLELPSSDDDATPTTLSNDEQYEKVEPHHEDDSSSVGVRYVKLLRKFSAGVGSPHCILERSATNTVTLRGCDGFETLVLRPLHTAPISMCSAGDSLELQSGDVLDIGDEHIQLKYMDPSAPPLTGRGRRTMPLSADPARLNPTTAADDATESERAMSSLFVSPASQGRCRADVQVGDMPTTPLRNFRCRLGSKDKGSEGEEVKEEDTGSHKSTENGKRYDAVCDYHDTEEEERSGSNADSSNSRMSSPAEQPEQAVRPLPTRPLIPMLALGKALLSVSPNALHPQQHVDPVGRSSMDDMNYTTSTTTATEEGDSRSSSKIASEWAASNTSLQDSSSGHPSRMLTFSEATMTTTNASTSKFKSRMPSKRAETGDGIAAGTATAGFAPHASLSLSELQSMRTNATSGNYRSELPASFIGRYNLVLVGPSGSGKTSLVNNLATPDKPWLRSVFSALTNSGVAETAATALHPTIGIRSKTLTTVGPVPMSLHTHELGGTPCFSPLLDQLPSHRVAYMLCFPLHGLTSLMTLRGVVEDILCRTDSHTVSLVLVGTHADRNAYGKEDGSVLSRLSLIRQEMMQRQLEEVEQQVVSLIQMLQPYPQLRPTVVGRFAVDNVYRHIYTTGYQAVETFPQWLHWLADFARNRCKADADFANGLVPARCIELGRQVIQLRQHGKWCVSLRDFKTLAAAVSSRYKSHTGEPPQPASQLAPTARDSLRHHIQLLADWGVLMHRYRSLSLRQHIILDVAWLSRLLTALACCPLIAAAESDGLSNGEAATIIDIVGEEGAMSLTRKEAALRTLLTPEAEQVVDMVKVATTDTSHLLRSGVLSMPVLIAMLEPHFAQSNAAEADGRGVVVGRMVDSTSAQQQLVSLKGLHGNNGRHTLFPSSVGGRGGTVGNGLTCYSVPLAGVVEFLMLLDLIIPGSKLFFSPSADARRCSTAATMSTTRKDGHVKLDTEEAAASGENESFVLYPLSFRIPASAGVTWIFSCFLSGPFYVFKLDMVPRNFFPKLLCRLATVVDKIYLGPVEKKLWGSATQRWPKDPTRARSVVGKGSSIVTTTTMKASPTTALIRGPFDSYFEHRAGSPFVLPNFTPYPAGTTTDGRLHQRDGFWFDAAWLIYNGDDEDNSDGEVKDRDRCRVLVRLVHHSVFLSFHCHSVATQSTMLSSSPATAAAVYGGDRASAGVQDFYEAVLEAVRYVVEEFPGGKCVESLQCCVDSATLLQSEQQHPAMQTDQEAAAQDCHMRFANINDNINNLERVLAKSGAALRTARTARPINILTPGVINRAGAEEEDENTYVPFLRHFSEIPPLSIHECIRRWKSEQRLHITPDVEASLTTALHNLEECYHGDAPLASLDSCAKLDDLLDVLARVDIT